jgi:uncharacterized membrane protein YfcA
MTNLLYSITGFGIGLLVGMTGLGGGSLLTPLLIVPFGVPNPRLQAKRRVDEVALCDDID